MFKLDSYLLYLILWQLIAVILYTQSLPGVGIGNSIANIHPLVSIIILGELFFAGFLMYKGSCAKPRNARLNFLQHTNRKKHSDCNKKSSFL